MASAKNFLKEYEKDLIVATIRKAELETTGEIRVHIDDRCDEKAFDRAVKLFYHLNIDKTLFKNGVLIYIAAEDRKFAVIGDEAIHQKVDNDFWNSITQKLHNDFLESNYCKGIVESIERISEILINYFPQTDNWKHNELDDEISFE
ncbi:MAG: TPM domain-containing protein [Chitinophagales bacterium]|nr:TPM domain-containing protein [Saprospirales bacterium]MBK8352930.1 TPM domain-containing protein [Saprospirales bacterium]MBP6659635.1 TPM domain-containing protein [Chitinophagales bacterium]